MGLGPGPTASKIKVRHDPARNDIRSILGAGGHYIVDLSTAVGGVVVIPEAYRQCRWYEVDVGGPVRFTYNNDIPEAHTVNLLAIEGANDQYPDISHVYSTLGDNSTPCSCQVYNASGVLVNGIRLVM